MKTLAALALCLAPASSFATEAEERPKRELPCSDWRGTVSGNDPHVDITATLCESGSRVTGRLVWTSKRSGSSVRMIEGSWSAGRRTLELRDTKLDGRPNPGWIFCIIDRYQLTARGPESLDGSYRSSACHDNATISLVRVR